MSQIPILAWQAELSHDYHERSRISTYRVSRGPHRAILFCDAAAVADIRIVENHA